MIDVDVGYWKNKRVFLTGHTGFKGAWMSFWLRKLGAHVSGYALPNEEGKSLHRVLDLPDDQLSDICNHDALAAAISAADPEIVFHFAAQALVRDSYEDPVSTFATNVTGTASLLNAVRQAPSARAVVVVTTDKCYENHEWAWGYRECDQLGGHDPYSASKGAAELVVASMRRSFFAPYRSDGHQARLVTMRAGNVIGGGDWAKDRLVPDIVRSMETGRVHLRNPNAIRPWQHVLEPLAAYLGIAQILSNDGHGFDAAYNIGPDDTDIRSVLELTNAIAGHFDNIKVTNDDAITHPHEANLLRLDCSLAKSKLLWRPRWGFSKAVEMTAEWYKAYSENVDMVEFTSSQIDLFQQDSPYR